MSPQVIPKLVYYDADRRRLWIRGQRCHHGATGALLAAASLAALRTAPRAVFVAAGTVLMAHDWRDRSLWFQRGWQDQP
jgi:hypothetical protein